MDCFIDVPMGASILSDLLAAVTTTTANTLTLRIPTDGSLDIDDCQAPDWCRNVRMLWITGPMPAPVHNRYNASTYKGPLARLCGSAMSLARAFPNIELLDIRGVSYDVDWYGWAAAATSLQRLVLSEYENLKRPLEFPGGCDVELCGLVSHYMSDPHGTLQFLKGAVGCGDCAPPRRFCWSLSYYDPDQQELLRLLEDAGVNIQGPQGRGSIKGGPA